MALSSVLMAASIGSGVLGAVGAVQQGQAMAAAERHNADVAGMNAVAAREAAAEGARQSERRNRRLLATTRARTAASGLMMEGSPLEVLADNAAEAELERLTILHGGETRARQFEGESSFRRSRAGAFATAGLLSGASSLVRTAGQAWSVRGPATSAQVAGGGVPGGGHWPGAG